MRALAILVALSIAGEPLLSDATAQGHFEAALGHFKAKEYDQAVEELEAARAIEDHPKLLLALGNAERLRGHCERSAVLVEEFLATKPDDKDAAAAKDILSKECEQAEQPPPPAVEPVEEPKPPPPEPVQEPATQRPAPVEPDQRSPKEWHRDVLGGVLVGFGAATLAAGTGLVISARIRNSNADERTSHQEFRDDLDRVVVHERVGAALLSVGAAVLVGGVVRYIVVARRGRNGRGTKRASR